MIILRSVCLSFGEQTLFDHIQCNFDFTQKIGVFGRNGSGKSTLLQAIAGKQTLDQGTIEIKRESIIGYMPQSAILSSTKTVFDETLSLFDAFLTMERRSQELEQLLHNSPTDGDKLIEEYLELQEKLINFDRIATEKKANEILDGLGFGIRKTQPVDTLSVGWKMRVVLAKLLLTDADFYLFDEPTNHLDLPSKEWFFSYLKQASFGYLLVTHDRSFLDKACDFIFSLERGKGRLFTGNFSDFIKQKEQEDAITKAAYKQQQKDIAQKQRTIDRFRASASKAKMVQSMIKRLEKTERIDIEPVLPTVSFSFPPPTTPGKVVLTIKDLAHQFSNVPLFTNGNAIIMRGQKVALVAPNGSGKTTLFNLITQKLPLQKGSIELGHNVEMAYFEQDQTLVLAPNKTILQEVTDSAPHAQESTIRALLGSFLFPGDAVNKKINVLSGGEKNRVAMVKVLLKKANFLVLDEPTNHLDLQAKDILLQALQQYTGTILIVSHDHDFIQKLADTVIELNNKGLFSFPGSYEAYLTHTQEKVIPTPRPVAKPQTEQPKQNQNNHRSLKKLERDIERLEKQRDELYCTLYEHEYGSATYQTIEQQVTQVKNKLEECLTMWEELAT